MARILSHYFDNEGVMTIGDIAVDWKNGEKIWIGTGECNSSRSSYSGTGMYYSEKWRQNVGTSRFGRNASHWAVLLHPTNPNILWVAAIGHLYSKNEERGVFKTVDGGKTWQKTLFINDSTGAIDVIIDPKTTIFCMQALGQEAVWRGILMEKEAEAAFIKV